MVTYIMVALSVVTYIMAAGPFTAHPPGFFEAIVSVTRDMESYNRMEYFGLFSFSLFFPRISLNIFKKRDKKCMTAHFRVH